MATQRGASISTKLILTSIVLILLIIGLLGATSIYYSQRTFTEAGRRLSEAYNSALDTRAEAQTLTIVESARTALMQTDYSSLQNFVPQAAKIDRDIVAIYVITDNGFVAAHSDPRLKEKPVSEVDPVLGTQMAQIDKPLTKELPADGAAKERRKLFARPVMASGKKFGTLVVIYSMAALDRQLEDTERVKRADIQSFGVQIGLLGLVFLLASAGIAVFQALRITRPIKMLAIRADQIAGGDLTTRVEVSSPDEIGMLAENFNYMADRLQVLLDETAAKAVLEKEVEKELELARAIQETLVPPADLIERGPLKVAGFFQPATQCGGDWWAVHDIAEGRVMIIIGDVTGHGVPAAMITAAAKAACDVGRALEGPRLTPSRLLELMNRAIFESARRKFVMTCFACLIDIRGRTITYANAGHNFPYLYRSPGSLQGNESEFTVLMSRGNRLGDIPDSTFTETTQSLRSGDRLVFYTDGLIECESPAGEEYGEKRLRNSIRAAAEQGPSQMRDTLMATAAQFYAERPRKDDITLVVAHLQ